MRQPKFYSNLQDDNHCMQASLMIVLNTLAGKTTWNEVNKLTEYKDNLYSWSVVGAKVLNDKIPGTRLIGTLDYKKFANDGERYLKDVWGQEWYDLQKKHASPNFSKEQESAKKLVKKGLTKRKKFVAKKDIKDYLKNNLIIALIDPHVIKNTPGSSGHFVVVYTSKSTNFLLHDPGLPPQEQWTVDQDVFMKAYRGDIIIIPKS